MWGITYRATAVLAIIGASLSITSPASATVAGSICKKQGQTLISSGKMHTCIKSGSKLVWSAAKPAVVTIANSPNPKISGKAVVDETLTAIPGNWDAGVSLNYQWLVGTAAIPGADDRTFVPSDALVGKRISVRVTGSKAGAKSVTRVSAATAAVKPPLETSSPTQTLKVLTKTSTPVITGLAQVNGRLEAQPGNWDSGVRFSYQWIKDNNPIEGATRFSYVPTESDQGANLAVAVTGTKSGFRSVTRISQPSLIAYSLLQFSSIAAVQIKGDPQVGSTLTANVASWGVTGIKFQYQWFANGVSIPGASTSTLKLADSQANQLISLVVTGQKTGYQTESRGSLPVGPVQSSATASLLQFLNPTEPQVSGNLTPGALLTATTQAWDAGVTYAWQWYRNGKPIPGATNITYLVQSEDTDKQITVSVSGSKSGYAPQTRTAVAGFITAGMFSSTPDPVIEGEAIEGSTLRLSAGSLSWGAPARTSIQWLKNGVAITGANSSTYVIGPSDVGSVFSVAVSGSAPGFATVMRTSVATQVVVSATLVGTKPNIVGTSQVGQTLSVNPGYWEPGTTLSYQWLRNGSEIAGATGPALSLSNLDNGTWISIRVTGSKTRMADLVLTSDPVKITTTTLSLTPTPTITGIPRLGQTLTANAGIWDQGVSLQYQWNRDGSPISGATSVNYVISSTDLEKSLTVSVTGSKPDFTSVTKSSAPIAVVLSEFTLAPVPVISGTAMEAQTLTSTAGTWDSGTTLSYQWKADGMAISGATGSTFKLTSAQVGKAITLTITGSKPGFRSTERTSAPVTVLSNALVLTPTPTITGTPQTGQILSLSVGTWDTGVSLSYQWRRNGVAISGATGLTYVVVAGDVSQAITVTVTGIKSGFVSASRTSAAVTVTAAQFLAAAVPVISGTAALDQTLTATAGTWTPIASLAYQWMADGVNISGATSSTLYLGSAQVGKKISVLVTGSRSGYSTISRTSLETAVVTAGSFTSQPTPVLSGTAMVGKVLTATAGSWDSGTTLAYQWMRGSTAISGAVSTTYSLVSADLGATITVRVTATKAGNLPVSKTSAGLGPVAAAAILVQGTPTVGGTPQVGLVLTGSLGTWESGLTFTYQWLRNGSAILGATGSTYTLAPADLAAVIALRVTGSNGFASATKQSSATTAVQPGIFASSPAATFSGAYKVGTNLTALVTGWSPSATFTYKWLKNGTVVAGATSTTFTLRPEDFGASFTFELTGSALGYTTKTVQSSPAGTVATGDISPAPAPTITGTPKVGQTLTANLGTWMSGTTLSYQWTKNGSNISGATNATYVIQDADAGSLISVFAIGQATGYKGVAIPSANIKILTPPKLPTISSQFSRTTGFDVNWSWHPNTSYVFTAKNPAGSVVGSYSCSTACASPFSISNLPGNTSSVTYTLEYTATTDGGSISGSTTASTYPTLNLNVNVTSIVRTGNQYILNFDTIPGWTYQFTNYAPYDNSNCGITSGVQTTSPFTMWLPKGLCTVEFIITDGRGNRTVRAISAPPVTTNPLPAPALSGSLSTTSATVDGNVSYTATYLSYINYQSYNLVILNSSGVAVNPAISPTSTRVGDLSSGTKSGVIYFLGLAPGTYTIRLDFKNSNDTRYGYAQEASVTIGTVTVTG